MSFRLKANHWAIHGYSAIVLLVIATVATLICGGLYMAYKKRYLG
jgi:hypothetical protein